MDDCLLKQTHLFSTADNILASFFAILETGVVPPGRAILQAQLKALEEVKQKMVEADEMTSYAVALDKPNAATYRSEGQAKDIKVIEQVQEAKNLVAGHDNAVSQPAEAPRLEDKTEERLTLTLKAGKTCFTCNKEGNRFLECPEMSKTGQKFYAKMRIAPKVCHVCSSQHSFLSKTGQTLYRTRFSSCPTFVKFGPEERASITQVL